MSRFATLMHASRLLDVQWCVTALTFLCALFAACAPVSAGGERSPGDAVPGRMSSGARSTAATGIGPTFAAPSGVGSTAGMGPSTRAIAPGARGAHSAPPADGADPHVHDPVTADELGITEELGVARTDAGGCESCSRTAPLSDEARAALVAIARRSRHCYGVARVADPRVHGTLRVALTIGAQGDTCSAEVRDGTMHSRAVDDCVEKLFRELRGIPGITSCVRVEVPLKFEDGDAKTETPG